MATELGVKQQSYWHYERQREIPPEVVLKLVRNFKISPNWLFNGVGPWRLAEDEPIPAGVVNFGQALAELVAARQEVHEAHKEMTVQLALNRRYDPHSVGEAEEPYGMPRLVAVPILGGHIAAGAGGVVLEDEVEDMAFCHAPHVPHPSQTTAVRVQGDSMLNLIADGDLVGVDHAVTDLDAILAGHSPLAVVRDDDVAIVRWAERLAPDLVVFRPYNRRGDFPTITWHGDAESPIIGKVIWIHRHI